MDIYIYYQYIYQVTSSLSNANILMSYPLLWSCANHRPNVLCFYFSVLNRKTYLSTTTRITTTTMTFFYIYIEILLHSSQQSNLTNSVLYSKDIHYILIHICAYIYIYLCVYVCIYICIVCFLCWWMEGGGMMKKHIYSIIC